MGDPQAVQSSAPGPEANPIVAQPHDVEKNAMSQESAAPLPVAVRLQRDVSLIDAEKAVLEIDRLSEVREPSSFQTICEFLTHPDPKVRKASRTALREADDRGIVKDIRAVASLTSDPREVAELLDLVDYINLPSITELEEAGYTFATNNTPRLGVAKDNIKASTVSANASAIGSGQESATLIRLQEENERLKKENQDIREILKPIIPE